MRRILTALAAAVMAAALLAPPASARLRVTFRYLGVHPKVRYLGVNPKLGRVIDRPPADVSLGYSWFSLRYTLRTGRGVVGTALFTFRATSKTRVRLRFREGTLLARGAFDANTGVLRFRVMGGTGAFRGSRGVVDGAEAANDNIRLTLRLF